MKTTLYKFAITGLLLHGLSACSLGTYFQSKQVLNKIHSGMTDEEVCALIGKPDFRRFNQDIEEWEYRKWISGNNTVILVNFENGRVISMDSFNAPQPPQPPVTPAPPAAIPEQHPSQPNRLHRMSDAKFQSFYNKISKELFSDERNDMIRALSKSKRLTCKQCAKLLTFYSFEDEKMTAFRWFAPHLIDKENYNEIKKQFIFSTDQEKIKNILGI